MRLPRMKPGDLIIVKLYDITGCNKWISDIEAQDFMARMCSFCGWFINSDKKFLRISDKLCEDGDKTITVIPRGFLRSVQVVPYTKVKLS